MELHLVGGFLGSGKTTAIIKGAQLLIERGLRVGIITNEQGKHLVDTGFIEAQGMPVLEVTGGCICCHLDDFKERIEEITQRFNPHVIFAESVGSCTDLVATVIKPLADFRKTTAQPTSLSVFADSRLLLRFLRGQEMPFSESIIYIFEKQIQETGLLVINKIDLLSSKDAEDVIRLAQDRFSGKRIRPQNSLDEMEVKDWLALIESRKIVMPSESLDLDYETYAEGEGKFAWLDRGLEMEFVETNSGEKVSSLIERIVDVFSAKELQVVHIKFLVNAPGLSCKINLTGMDDPNLDDQIAELKKYHHNHIDLLINAMVIGDAVFLEGQLNKTIDHYCKENDINFRETKRFTRVPGYPKPTMRIGN